VDGWAAPRCCCFELLDVCGLLKCSRLARNIAAAVLYCWDPRQECSEASRQAGVSLVLTRGGLATVLCRARGTRRRRAEQYHPIESTRERGVEVEGGKKPEGRREEEIEIQSLGVWDAEKHGLKKKA
jgi:hypothetical protein